MGGTNSTLLSNAFIANERDTFAKEYQEVNEFQTVVRNAHARHMERLATFRLVKNKNLPVIQLEQTNQGQLLEHERLSAALYALDNNLRKEDLDALCMIHAIHGERSQGDEPNTFKLRFFPDFELAYEQFLTKVALLLDYKALSLTNPANDADTLKTVDMVNRYLLRNIFMIYGVVYNDYVSLVYTMYAISQFRLLNDAFMVAKKKGEFDVVFRELQSELDQTFEKTDPITRATENMEQVVRMIDSNKPSAGDDQGSSTLLLTKLKTVHAQTLATYNLSNKNLEHYLALVNKFLSVQLIELNSFYRKLNEDKILVNGKLRAVIVDAIEDISKLHTIEKSNNNEREDREEVQRIVDQYLDDSRLQSPEDRRVFVNSFRNVDKILYMTKANKEFRDNADQVREAFNIMREEHSSDSESATSNATEFPRMQDNIMFDSTPPSTPRSSGGRKVGYRKK